MWFSFFYKKRTAQYTPECSKNCFNGFLRMASDKLLQAITTFLISRVQNKPILPPVIAMGGRLREAIEEDTKEELDDYDEDEDDDEGFVEGTIFGYFRRFLSFLRV